MTDIDDIGFGIENYAGTALWRFQVGVDDLALIFNETHVGSFNSVNGFYNPSDQRLKNNVQTLQPALEKMLKLRPASYYYNHDKNAPNRSYGFIAQEVQEIFPDLVLNNQVNDLLMITTTNSYHYLLRVSKN